VHLPYPTTPPIDLLLKQLMQWKLNKITNNHNTKEAWRSPSFASFSHLALCSLPDFVQNLLICSSPGGTRNTAFLIVQCSHCHIWFFPLLSSFHCSVLTIVFCGWLEDDCFLQWVSSHRQSERPQVSRPLVRWWSAGRRWRSTTRALLTAHNESAILFRIWRFFLTLSQRWIFRYGCVGCVRKKRIHYWAKIVVFWLSSDPQHKSFLLTLIQGSVVFGGSSRRNHWLGQLVCQRTTLHSN